MGLPIGRLRVATNVNDILARTLSSGAYEVREVHETSSPSMDIQVSSNFERLVFEATNRDSAAVRGLMASLGQSGRFVLPAAALRSIREQFDAGRADEDEVNAAIRAAWRESGDLIDPHTAVAVAVSEHASASPNVPNIVLSTAHAAKFPDAVQAACGTRPALPAYLGSLMTKPEKITPMPNDRVELERFIRSASRAAKEPA
jgi:threonine synthase